LLQFLGRNGPELSQVVADLETLLAQPSSPAAAPAEDGAKAYAPGVDAGSLDMTRPT
jgi:hypothetical protein